MKKFILFLIFYSSISNAINLADSESYQNYVNEIIEDNEGNIELKKAEILKIFHQALEDFKIEKDSIKFIFDNQGNYAAAANSFRKIIWINPESFKNENYDLWCASWRFTAYHEIGHLIDDANWKKAKKETSYKLLIDILSFPFIRALSYKLVSIFKAEPVNYRSFEFKSFILTNLLSYIFSTKVSEKLLVKFNENIEHTANLIACEKLIEKNDIVPILNKLFHLKLQTKLGFKYDPKKDSYHNHKEQLIRIEKFLKDKGFEIKYIEDIISEDSEKMYFEVQIKKNDQTYYVYGTFEK